MARLLGWFSIGLGVAELVVPETISRLSGVKSHRIIKFAGLREIATGVAVLQPAAGYLAGDERSSDVWSVGLPSAERSSFQRE